MKNYKSSSIAMASALFLILTITNAQAGDLDFSLYSGLQGASDSDVTVTDGTAFRASWEGKSFDLPPYYGVRGTFWLTEFGFDDIGLVAD